MTPEFNFKIIMSLLQNHQANLDNLKRISELQYTTAVFILKDDRKNIIYSLNKDPPLEYYPFQVLLLTMRL